MKVVYTAALEIKTVHYRNWTAPTAYIEEWDNNNVYKLCQVL